MLDSFLETHIQNKLKILGTLFFDDHVPYQKLCITFHLSLQGVISLIDEINSEIRKLGKIEKQSCFFSFHAYGKTNFFNLFQTISQNSSVLHCLKFMILNDENKAFLEFAEQEYLTKSTAYRIRQKCLEYLQLIGLNAKKNCVTGEEYRIRFLIALLHYKYGIDCYEMDNKSIQIIRNFILYTNQAIDLHYLEQTESEYGFFEYLFMLSWKRANYPLSKLYSKELNQAKEIFIYKEMKIALKKTIEPALHRFFSENDYDYLFLVYCCTNSCVFADKWTQQDIRLVHHIIFSDKTFHDLLQRLESILPPDVLTSHSLRSTLIYFYKKCLLELQCIIPDKNFSIYTRKNHLTEILFQRINDILLQWSEANGLKYKLDRNHVLYLVLQLEFILLQFIKTIPVFVLSDLNAELEVMQLHLSRLFSSKKINIVPFLLNTQNKETLCSQKNCIIIVHQKFQHLITSWKLEKQNIIIPVTVEMTNNEISAIQNAITYYEHLFFLDLINNHK